MQYEHNRANWLETAIILMYIIIQKLFTFLLNFLFIEKYKALYNSKTFLSLIKMLYTVYK